MTWAIFFTDLMLFAVHSAPNVRPRYFKSWYSQLSCLTFNILIWFIWR